jgi:hypothetical protein
MGFVVLQHSYLLLQHSIFFLFAVQKNLKNTFSNKLSYLSLPSHDKEMHCLLLQLLCLSVHYVLLHVDFTQYISRKLVANGETFSQAVFVISRMAKPPRRLFLPFREPRNLLARYFYRFDNGETVSQVVLEVSPMAVTA